MTNSTDHDKLVTLIVEVENIDLGIRAIRDWQRNHDIQELQQYGKIEAHMASSEESRSNLAKGIENCEISIRHLDEIIVSIRKNLWYTMGMVAILAGTATTLGWMFINHLIQHVK